MSSLPPLYTYPLKPVSWNERDVLLFANSIGCAPRQDLHFLYELHPRFAAFPTYPIVLTFKHDYSTVTSFANHFTRHLTPPQNFVPGFPALDVERVVDGERTLEVLRPIPPSSAHRSFHILSTVTAIWDKGPTKPAIVQTQHLLIESSRTAAGIGGQKSEAVYTRMSETAIFMGQGGWGGPNPPSPSPSAGPPSTTKPTRIVRHEISPTAHLLYRLNGDYNPLHATEVKAAVVQPTPIMHGLYSWNVAARIIWAEFGGSETVSLRDFRARFARPVRPGDVLEILMWEGEKGVGGGEREVRFVVTVKGEVVLDKGSAVLRGLVKDGRGRL